jgi:hypothetical protein
VDTWISGTFVAAQAAASSRGPSAFTAKARAASVSAASTAL